MFSIRSHVHFSSQYYNDDIDRIREVFDEKQQTFLRLRHISWSALFTEARMLGESLCAELRRRASLLHDLSFDTYEERDHCMGRWKAAKMALAAAHAECDEWSDIIRNVAAGAFIFNTYRAVRDDIVNAIQFRMMHSLDCFERAYRKAAARLPTTELERYEVPLAELDKELHANSSCTICQSPLGDGHVYKLPCSHCFHEQCLRRWLHDNSSCPVCRFDLEGVSRACEPSGTP